MTRYDDNGAAAGQRITWIGAIANGVLIACKFTMGVWGNSQALIADAVHSLSDFVTDAIVLVGLRLGRMAPDQSHPFGHRRLETLASAGVGGALLVAAAYLGYESVQSIYDHVDQRPNALALLGAAISLVVKEMLYRYTVRVGRRIKSPAVVANAWHHRSDALSSIAVLVGVAGTLFNPDWHILDSVTALLVSFFIARVGVKVAYEAVLEVVDTAPQPEVVDRIREIICRGAEILDVHGLKIRTIGGLYHVQVDIVVDGRLTVDHGHRIARAVSARLHGEMDEVCEVIVHVDPDQGQCPLPS